MFAQNFLVAFPLFALIGLGFLCTKLNLLTDSVGTGLSKYAFVIALPMLLFNVMSNITHLPPPNWFIAIAFWVLLHRFCNRKSHRRQVLKIKWRRAKRSFGMAGVFSNNVQLLEFLLLSLFSARRPCHRLPLFSL